MMARISAGEGMSTPTRSLPRRPIGNEKLLKRIELDRKAETAWRARKRTINSLPKRIGETVTKGRELVQAAKGLG